MLISLYSIIGMIKYIITSFLFHIMYFKALYLYSQYRTASKALLHEKVYWIMYEMLYNFQYITNKLDSICFKGRIMSFRAKRARQCLWCALASVVENTSFLLGRALCITGGLCYTWANAEREKTRLSWCGSCWERKKWIVYKTSRWNVSCFTSSVNFVSDVSHINPWKKVNSFKINVQYILKLYNKLY